jgi:hypothetical protein
MGLFEMNAAAEIIHGVAHQDANIIFGTVVDDEMGDEVKVTVIAAGFDRWDAGGPNQKPGLKAVETKAPTTLKDLFADEPAVPDALRALPNVVLSPHQGSATLETRLAMGRLLVENLVAFADGRPLPTPVATPAAEGRA